MQDSDLKKSIEEQLNKNKLALGEILKSELKIGMFPEKVSIEFLKDFYFKKTPFYDETRKVSSIKLQMDLDSLLRE